MVSHTRLHLSTRHTSKNAFDFPGHTRLSRRLGLVTMTTSVQCVWPVPSRRTAAHWSGSNGHVVPVAGRSLGAAVAAQVLVDAGHLLGGQAISHPQALAAAAAAAVSLHAPHVD